ncbi:MAG: tRNA pseudouridine(55) synthase TruB [Gammaproteobacteria bacterium]
MPESAPGRGSRRGRAGSQARSVWRDVDGILVLDKPLGITSNRALQSARRIFQARKAGHTGSLDPLATGVLPLCFGEATKFSAVLLDSNKVYEVTGRLGERTDTGDAAGAQVERSDPQQVTREQIIDSLAGFRGDIAQVPPMYSALKHQGQRLYDIARKGGTVERAPRRVTIHELEFLDWHPPEFCLRVSCSKGTYIRTLIEDIGAALGQCAHVQKLHRTVAGPFSLAQALSLGRLEEVAAGGVAALDALLIGADAAVTHLPELHFDADDAKRLIQGQAVPAPASGPGGQVRLYGADGRFLGLGQWDPAGKVHPQRMFNAARVGRTC